MGPCYIPTAARAFNVIPGKSRGTSKLILISVAST